MQIPLMTIYESQEDNDRALAREVRTAVSNLNKALGKCNDAGLHVELDHISLTVVGKRYRERIYSAVVERRTEIMP